MILSGTVASECLAHSVYMLGLLEILYCRWLDYFSDVRLLRPGPEPGCRPPPPSGECDLLLRTLVILTLEQNSSLVLGPQGEKWLPLGCTNADSCFTDIG